MNELEKPKCNMCAGKEWMILEFHPLMREHDKVAPCLMCSSHKNLNEIKERRQVTIQRGENKCWQEYPLS